MVNNRSAPGQKHGHRGKSSFFHQIVKKTLFPKRFFFCSVVSFWGAVPAGIPGSTPGRTRGARLLSHSPEDTPRIPRVSQDIPRQLGSLPLGNLARSSAAGRLSNLPRCSLAAKRCPRWGSPLPNVGNAHSIHHAVGGVPGGVPGDHPRIASRISLILASL